MTSRIRHKRASTANKVPLLTDLELGELAINTRDGRIFSRINDGTDRIIMLGAEMSALLAGALKQSTGAAFMGALGVAPSAGFDLIDARAATGTEQIFNGLGVYRDVMLVGLGVNSGVAATIQARVGAAGADIATSVYNHPSSAIDYMFCSDSATAARSFSMIIHNFNRTDAIKPVTVGSARNTYTNWPVAIASATAFDRLRVYPSTGSFSAGTIYVLGRS